LSSFVTCWRSRSTKPLGLNFGFESHQLVALVRMTSKTPKVFPPLVLHAIASVSSPILLQLLQGNCEATGTNLRTPCGGSSCGVLRYTRWRTSPLRTWRQDTDIRCRNVDHFQLANHSSPQFFPRKDPIWGLARRTLLTPLKFLLSRIHL